MTWAIEEKDYSRRQACRLVGIDPKTYRYASRRPDDTALRKRLRALTTDRRQFGYWRLRILSRLKSLRMNNNTSFDSTAKSGLVRVSGTAGSEHWGAAGRWLSRTTEPMLVAGHPSRTRWPARDHFGCSRSPMISPALHDAQVGRNESGPGLAGQGRRPVRRHTRFLVSSGSRSLLNNEALRRYPTAILTIF